MHAHYTRGVGISAKWENNDGKNSHGDRKLALDSRTPTSQNSLVLSPTYIHPKMTNGDLLLFAMLPSLSRSLRVNIKWLLREHLFG